MIEFTTSGSISRTQSFLNSLRSVDPTASLHALGARGVAALQAATPTESGLTAASWSYEIIEENGGVTITWINSHNEGGVNIAVILQYGHGTGTGGYVAGRDYINPAIQPIFDEIANDVWRKVTSA